MTEIDQNDIISLFEKDGVIMRGHFVLRSGRHGDTYVNKDLAYVSAFSISGLCYMIADHFKNNGIDVVIAPAIGGVVLTQWVGYHLSALTGLTIYSVYAEKEGNGFVIRRGYGGYVIDRHVLVLEDVLTTGGSAKAVINAVRAIGGNVRRLGALCNRGGVTAEEVGIDELYSLVNLNLPTWDPPECPQCIAGVPLDSTVGHAKK
jgi:orotate phosphoribosyltransferase